MSKYDYLLEKFNEGDLEEMLIPLRGNILPIISLIDRGGLLDEIDLSETLNRDYHNDVYSYIAEKYPEKFQSMIIDLFSNEISLEDDGRVFLTLGDKGDLSELFCDGYRNSLSQKSIRAILDGENDWVRFDETTDNVYRDVIEDLSPKNQQILYQRILKDSQEETEKILPETELLEEIAEEQGHDDFVELTEENIPRIFSDEDSALSVLGILENLNSDLYSVHSNAYNSAYESELYQEVMDSMNYFFVGNGDWVSKPSPKDPTKTQYNFKIEVNDFYGLMKKYFDEMRREDDDHTVDYQGTFMNVLSDGIYMDVYDCISVHVSDYADWSKVKEEIDDLFSDYI